MTCQRDKFSLPDDVAYLNCAYMSPLPETVEMAGYQAVARKTLPYEIFPKDFFEPVANLKKQFAHLINADDFERIAIIPSVSYGMANVARNVKASPGQNIVLVEDIFPSNYYCWKRLSDESGAKLRIVQAPPQGEGRGAVWNERLLEAIDSQTVLVAVPNVHWADGTLFDLKALRQRSKEVGAMLVVDGTQSVGAMPFDVAEIQPDALVCAGYKWLLGAYGFGMAYFGENFDGGTPIEENWINRLDSHRFERLVDYQDEYQPKAHRYCMGENSQFISVPMQAAALDMILSWGVENIQAYARQLSEPYLAQLVSLGCWVEDAQWRGGHLVGVRFPKGVDLKMLQEKAAAAQVYVSFRGDSVRISTHVWNNERDFEKLMEVLRNFK